jgi:polar amino acid transport system substrate-binding protein
MIVVSTACRGEEQAPDYSVPLFRQTTIGDKPPELPENQRRLKLLVDDGFPPFHFRDESGRLTGFTVELAQAACQELSVSCDFVVAPFGDLPRALAVGEGDMVVAAVRLNSAILESAGTTRPVYRAMARFMRRKNDETVDLSPAGLQGRRIAAAAGSAHAAWLRRYYEKAEIVTAQDEGAAASLLQRGEVAFVFGDALPLIFWMRSQRAANCCEMVGDAFIDTAYFSHPLSFLVRRNDTVLKDAFDWALDRLEAEGKTGELFRRYVPASPWSAANLSASQPTASSSRP